MEKSIREAFGLKQTDPVRVPSLSLAYVGDAVFALFVRTLLLERRNGPNGALHSRALPYVSAVGQAKMAEGLQEMLTEEETAVFRRGRNAKPEHGAKNASTREYHLATGLEALFGYLYLQDREERITELLKAGMPYAEQ
ncbi:MAG: ribonuclease III [Lachnospiraceae bacterium]|nr:ribonuclease III [Lachnospiraceae bacterium]